MEPIENVNARIEDLIDSAVLCGITGRKLAAVFLEGANQAGALETDRPEKLCNALGNFIEIVRESTLQLAVKVVGLVQTNLVATDTAEQALNAVLKGLNGEE